MRTEKSDDSKNMSFVDAEAGAMLLPPKPPPPGVVRVEFAKGSTWSVHEGTWVVQVDIKVGPAEKGWREKLKRLVTKSR